MNCASAPFSRLRVTFWNQGIKATHMIQRNGHSIIVPMWIVFALFWTGCSSDDAKLTRTDAPPRTVAPAVRDLLLEGQEDYQLGFYQRALALADSAEAYHGELADIHFLRGNVYLGMKRLDAAREAFRQVVKLDPTLAGAWMKLGDIELEFGNPNEAVRLYRKEEEIHPHSALYEQLGQIYADAGVADSARMAYSNAIALDSLNATAHMMYGQLLEKLGDYDSALIYSRNALALNPNSPNYQFVVGSQLFRSGHPEEAGKYLKQAADALPLHYPAQYNLGQVLLRLGRDDEAHYYLVRADSARLLMDRISRLEQATSFNPSQIENWRRLGHLYRTAEMYDRAVEAFSMAASMQPGNLEVQRSLAETLVASGNTVEGIKLFLAILSFDETNVDVWLRLGLAYAVVGICDEAKIAWETALRHSPGNVAAMGYLSGLCQYVSE